MYMLYRDQYDQFGDLVKKVQISGDNFKFDHDGTGVWLTKKTTIEFIPMHMVRKVVFEKEEVDV